jgi:hypothetical protein
LVQHFDVVETTAFGNTARTRVAGLADNSVSLELNQDFASGSLESVIYPTLGTAVSITVKPVAGAVTTSNPAYSFSALVSEWTQWSRRRARNRIGHMADQRSNHKNNSII